MKPLQASAKELRTAAKDKDAEKVITTFENLVLAIDDFSKEYKKLK